MKHRKELIVVASTYFILLATWIFWTPAQKRDAIHLKELNCKVDECIAIGNMIRTDSVYDGKSRSATFFYEYSFVLHDQVYSRKVTFDYSSKQKLNYLPDKNNAFKPFKEEIVFDPKNPKINLPKDYVFSSPRAGTAKGYYLPNIFLILLMFWILYFGFKGRIKFFWWQ
ncbi:hypothetical protein [Neisseria sp. Ec49-e6-T10]|uniref:hypothetical protein n=1 Tax=Neisseria sp. Ec49-e6-T10 TaxID=3140744 RepID=UPI003EB72FFC